LDGAEQSAVDDDDDVDVVGTLNCVGMLVADIDDGLDEKEPKPFALIELLVMLLPAIIMTYSIRQERQIKKPSP
jgi:hypothetical protein